MTTDLQRAAFERKLYVASKTKHAAMWQKLRAEGHKIISTRIDEAGESQTDDMGELWQRIDSEVAACDALVFYMRYNDETLKGAYIEAGMALARGKRVYVVADGIDLEAPQYRPIGSWMNHPLVHFMPSISVAMKNASTFALASVPTPAFERPELPVVAWASMFGVTVASVTEHGPRAESWRSAGGDIRNLVTEESARAYGELCAAAALAASPSRVPESPLQVLKAKGWRFTVCGPKPFKGIEIVSPQGWSTAAFSYEMNPKNILHALCLDLLGTGEKT